GARGDAADRSAGDAGARLARRLAGDRRGHLADRFPAGLATDGASAGGYGAAPRRAGGWHLRLGGNPGRITRAELLAPAGNGHRRILAAAALHRTGLSSPGGGEPAPGGPSGGTWSRGDRCRGDRRLVLADVGARRCRLRAVPALAADPLSAGADRRVSRRGRARDDRNIFGERGVC